MKKRKIKIANGITVDAYAVLSRAVEEGVRYGWDRSHKHTDTPTPTDIQDQITNAVMNAVCEYFKFGEQE